MQSSWRNSLDETETAGCSSYGCCLSIHVHTLWNAPLLHRLRSKLIEGEMGPALTSHLFPDPGRSLWLVAVGRTMAGNWERSEGVPVGRMMLKTRAVAHLIQVDTGPPPWVLGTGLFKTLIRLLFEMFWRVWFHMSDVWRVGCLRCPAARLEKIIQTKLLEKQITFILVPHGWSHHSERSFSYL